MFTALESKKRNINIPTVHWLDRMFLFFIFFQASVRQMMIIPPQKNISISQLSRIWSENSVLQPATPVFKKQWQNRTGFPHLDISRPDTLTRPGWPDCWSGPVQVFPSLDIWAVMWPVAGLLSLSDLSLNLLRDNPYWLSFPEWFCKNCGFLNRI